MGRKRKSNKKPKVHEELEGLDLRINEFGEIVSNLDVEKINEFLTRTVPDKKLINRHDNAYQQEFRDLVKGDDDDDKDLLPVDEPEEADEDISALADDDDAPPPPAKKKGKGSKAAEEEE